MADIDFNKMKSDVFMAFVAAVGRRSRTQALGALDTYLEHVAMHSYGTPEEINDKLAAAVEAGLLTPEEVLSRNARATVRLVDGIFWSPGSKNPGTDRLALLLLPHADHDALVASLGRRWCLRAYNVTDALFPWASRYSDAGKAALAAIESEAVQAFTVAAADGRSTHSPELIESVVDRVGRRLAAELAAKVATGNAAFCEACIQAAAASDDVLVERLPASVLAAVFADGAHATERIRQDVTGRVTAAITEIIGGLSKTLASRFSTEKPSFDDWLKTPRGEALSQKLFDDGMEALAAVAEARSPDDSKTFIIFQSWNQLHMLERYVDLDSVDHGFSDEYSRCDCGSCSVAVRTSANSYSWQPGFISGSSGVVLLEHAEDDDIEEYIGERINRDSSAINCPGLDIARVGFRKLKGGYESGWHPGQNDNPEVILAELRKLWPKAEFLFRIDDVGQFDAAFSVWVRGEVGPVSITQE